MASGRGPLGDLSNGRSGDEPTRRERGPLLSRPLAGLERPCGAGGARVQRRAHAGAVLRERSLASCDHGTPGLVSGGGAALGRMDRRRRRGRIVRDRRRPRSSRIPRGSAAAKRRLGAVARPAVRRVRDGAYGGRRRARVCRSVGTGRDAKPANCARPAAGGRRARALRAGWIARADRRGDRPSRGTALDLGRPARLRPGRERLGRDGRSARRKRRAVRPQDEPLVKLARSPRRRLSAAESASSSR